MKGTRADVWHSRNRWRDRWRLLICAIKGHDEGDYMISEMDCWPETEIERCGRCLMWIVADQRRPRE